MRMNMDEESFLEIYIKPSEVYFNEYFRMPVPPIPGIRKTADFIVQSRRESTVSTNIIMKHETNDGVQLVEVYKNTENEMSGTFIRLVGSMALVRRGYPFMILDAAISNISPMNFTREDPTTRVVIHLPQADSDMSTIFFEDLKQAAQDMSIIGTIRETPALPDFWGKFWTAQFSSIAIEKINLLRITAWRAYESVCRNTQANDMFDYEPALNQIVFKNARTEHHIFKKMDLSVPIEAQSAFFSMLVAGV